LPRVSAHFARPHDEVDSVANRLEPFRKRRLYVVTLGTTPTPGTEATTMKVRDLIEILEDQDPDAEILIMSQQSWPFENAIAGVAVREEIVEDDEDLDDEEREEPRYEKGTAANDVFIVEGQQLRYGSKAAWDAARR
jgi:hypothetical protein